MELRILRYFMAVAKEGSITKAAETLHISQPSLSRQLQDFEKKLGKILLIRGGKKITLTEEGMLLRRRAEEIVDLAEKTEAEILQSDSVVGGDVWIGGGESEGMRYIARTAASLQRDYPNIRVHLISGNAPDIMERLEKGLVDFGVGMGIVDPSRYESFALPVTHTGGLLVRKDSPLASRSFICPGDLQGVPIISPRNESVRRRYEKWMGRSYETLNVVASFNLIYNAAFLVEEGVGCALCIDRLVEPSEGYPLCFIPYKPGMEIDVDITWKKQQLFSKASQKFLERLRDIVL